VCVVGAGGEWSSTLTFTNGSSPSPGEPWGSWAGYCWP